MAMSTLTIALTVTLNGKPEFSLGLAYGHKGQQIILDRPDWLAPFVPTPQRVVKAILRLAKVGENDLVYDLGSGDGRIIVMAALEFHARAVGIELDEDLCRKATLEIKRLQLDEQVRVIQGDIFTQDLRQATVVTIYLLPKSLEKLAPLLERQLKEGSRVVTVNSEISGWTYALRKEVKDKARATPYTLYLYERQNQPWRSHS